MCCVLYIRVVTVDNRIVQCACALIDTPISPKVSCMYGKIVPVDHPPPTLRLPRLCSPFELPPGTAGVYITYIHVHPTSDHKRHRYTGAARTLALAFRVGIQLFLLRSLRQSSFSHVHTHPWMWWMCYSMEEVYPCCCHVKSQIRSNLRHPSPH